MSDLLDLPSWKLGTGDLIQQISLLVELYKGDPELYKIVTASRVAYEVYNRVSGQSAIEAYQTQCILGIVDYIKKHPKASQKDLAKEVQTRIDVFKAQLNAM